MTEPTPLRAALADFASRHGVDLDTPLDDTPAEDDPFGRQEQIRLAVEYTTKHTPARYADALPDNPAVSEWVNRIIASAVADAAKSVTFWVKSGPSLLILGPTGTGKTHQAFGAMRLLAMSGVRAKWQAVAAADLYARLRPRHGVDSETEFRAIADAPALIVDDLGAAKGSEWVEEVNYRLVNWRYERIVPTLFTSNIPPRQLAEVLGERVASRLTEMTERVVLEGPDRRRVSA